MFRIRIERRIGWLAAMPFLLVAHATAVCAESVADDWATLNSKYAAELEQLATWCDQHHLAAEAQQTRAWHIDRDPHKLYVFVLPDSLAVPARLSENFDRAE